MLCRLGGLGRGGRLDHHGLKLRGDRLDVALDRQGRIDLGTCGGLGRLAAAR